MGGPNGDNRHGRDSARSLIGARAVPGQRRALEAADVFCEQLRAFGESVRRAESAVLLRSQESCPDPAPENARSQGFCPRRSGGGYDASPRASCAPARQPAATRLRVLGISGDLLA